MWRSAADAWRETDVPQRIQDPELPRACQQLLRIERLCAEQAAVLYPCPREIHAALCQSLGTPVACERCAELVQIFTIVTGPLELVSGDIHDRAPVILPSALRTDELTLDPARVLELLAAVSEPALTYYPVPKAVGTPRNSTPDLVHPIAA